MYSRSFPMNVTFNGISLVVAFFATSFTILSPATAQTSDFECDRQCLITTAEDYLSALVAHDPSELSLGDELKIVENLKPINTNEGLWKSASALPTDFKIFVPDPVSQQIGFIVVMQENPEDHSERSIEVAFRLQLKAGKIIEAEHLINHEVNAANENNLRSPRLPLVAKVTPSYQDSRSRLLAIGASYYDALVHNNGALAPFADDCVRHENGHQSSRNAVPADPINDFAVFSSMGCAAQLNTRIYSYIDTIDFRRINIADEQTGLVFGLSHFRHIMGKPEYRTLGVPGQETFIDDREPYDLSAIHIFKIWGGQIHEVEAVGYFTDYMNNTGWE